MKPDCPYCLHPAGCLHSGCFELDAETSEQSAAVSVDTISNLYLSRPINAAFMQFGMWFKNAMDLEDGDLNNQSLNHTKEIIAAKEYNKNPHLLAKLKEYNLVLANRYKTS
jgi:hypothetical protein